jgi:hypothetical protein
MWATPNDYAKSRGLNVHRVYNALQRRGLPYVKVHDKIYLNVEEADYWFKLHAGRNESPYK